jgi:hypothetical protein
MMAVIGCSTSCFRRVAGFDAVGDVTGTMKASIHDADKARDNREDARLVFWADMILSHTLRLNIQSRYGMVYAALLRFIGPVIQVDARCCLLTLLPFLYELLHQNALKHAVVCRSSSVRVASYLAV